MQIADMRIQTSAPTTPSAGVIGLYANASGILVTKTSAGQVYAVGQQVTGTIPASVVVTGTLLGGTVSGWLPIVGPNGQKWAVPAYGAAW